MGMLCDAEVRYDLTDYLEKVKTAKPSPVRSIVQGKRAFTYDEQSKMPMGLLNKRYNYRPSAYAREFHNSNARYRYLCWGIKSGKTKVGAIETCRYAIKFKNIMVWVVGPTNRHTEEAERMVLEILDSQEGVIVSRKESDREYVLYNGTKIQFRTGAKANNLRGPNVHFVWIDEAAFASHDVFKEVMKRTAATKGKIIVTTTPWGKNWFFDECVFAGMPKTAPYGEFTDEKGRRFISHRRTEEFPWVDQEDLDDARKRMSKTEYEQEFEAKFTARINAAFKRLQFHFRGCKFDSEQNYIMGTDFGMSQDYTAVIVMGSDGLVVFCKRWKDISYIEGVSLIKDVWNAWGRPIVLADESNVGVPVIEQMTEAGMTVFPVNFNSAKTKNEVIQAHQLAIESNRFVLPHPESEHAPADADVVKYEHEEYRVFLTDKGRISFGAPKGEHDDYVIAGALCTWGRMKALVAHMNRAQVAAQSLNIKAEKIEELMEKKRQNWIARQMQKRKGTITRLLTGGMYHLYNRRRAA